MSSMNNIVKGTGYSVGDHIDTDTIISAKYINQVPLNELYRHAMEVLDDKFNSKINPGDVLVAGKNFGCGSSREVAPLVLKDAGIAVVVAESIARIFYRNAINMGLAVMSIGAHDIKEGSKLTIDLTQGIVKDEETGRTYTGQSMPHIVMNIIKEGGLVNYLKKNGEFILSELDEAKL